MHRLNPFSYGKPVPPPRFVGRRDILRTVFSRLDQGDSTALLGLPHFGKSSILRYLSNPEVRTDWLGADGQALQVVQWDCHSLQNSAQPADLWRMLVEAASTAWGDDPAVHQAVTAVQKSAYSPLLLTRLFDQTLGARGRKIVLLLDEVEVLLHHVNFCQAEFLGLLRSLATQTEGLILIFASRISLTEMNRLSAKVNRGSPFFNNFIELQLPPLSTPEIHQLLDSSLAGHKPGFQPDDYGFVVDQSGGQPYLVQAVAAALFDVIGAGIPVGPTRYQRATAALHQRVGSYFDTLWRHLDGTLRQAMLLSGLGDRLGPSSHAVRTELRSLEQERLRLRQLGLLLPASDSESEDKQDRDSQENRMADSLLAWVLGHGLAAARSANANQWEDWLASSAKTRAKSDALRSLVLQHVEPSHLVAISLPDSPPSAKGASSRRSAALLTSGSVRNLLKALLRTAADLDGFCLDCFKDRVYKRFASGMDTTTRLNLLLEIVPAEEIIKQLERALPQEFANLRHLLRYE